MTQPSWRDTLRELATALEANTAELLGVTLKGKEQSLKAKDVALAYAAEVAKLEPIEKRVFELQQRGAYLCNRIRELEERYGDCGAYKFDERGQLEPASLIAALATVRLPRPEKWKEERELKVTVPRSEDLVSDDVDAVRAFRRHLLNAGDCSALWTLAEELHIGHRTFDTPIDDRRTRNLAS